MKSLSVWTIDGMALNVNERRQLKQKLARASGSAIRDVISRLKPYWEAQSWLSLHNPYQKDPVGRISSDIKSGRLANDHLAEYVAASAVIHCFDGWSYLGRALEAEMAGDPDASRHLGYYAELRAAMSVLASGGIGVFDSQHIVVDGAQVCDVLTKFGGTHNFVWNALEIWAESEVGYKSVFRSIKPGGLPLSEWLEQFHAGAHFVGTKWLQQWGLDLSRLTDDRRARNLASYRPTTFTSPGPRPISDTMKSILQIWEMCEPEGNGGFPILDRHLLRHSLGLVSHSLYQGGQLSAGAIRQYCQQVELMLSSIAPVSVPNGWHKFLSYKNLADIPKIVDDANGKDDAYHPSHSKQVLARATLLLRVATGCSEDLLSKATMDIKASLGFWRSSLSVRRRLWPESAPISSSLDLWSDVDDASSSIREWLEQKQKGSLACHHVLWTEQASAASTLATTERAFLWGVGL